MNIEIFSFTKNFRAYLTNSPVRYFSIKPQNNIFVKKSKCPMTFGNISAIEIATIKFKN